MMWRECGCLAVQLTVPCLVLLSACLIISPRACLLPLLSFTSIADDTLFCLRRLVLSSRLSHFYHHLYSVLSDAPAISFGQGGEQAGLSSSAAPSDDNQGRFTGDQWDDEALAAATTSRRVGGQSAGGNYSSSAAHAGSTGDAVLDIKQLGGGGASGSSKIDPDNIAEKLRVEETKAKLAAAREGMEREAARLEAERQKKEQDAAAKGPTSSVSSNTVGRWTAARMRNQQMGGGPSRNTELSAGKIDIRDEELFPDLASADKILEEKEKSLQASYFAPKKTPVGGGAGWGKAAVKKEVKREVAPPPAAAPAPARPVTPEKPKAAAPAAPAASAAKSTTTTATTEKKASTAVKPKKKKDLSTFNPTKPSS
jgi:hypothetical protein